MLKKQRCSTREIQLLRIILTKWQTGLFRAAVLVSFFSFGSLAAQNTPGTCMECHSDNSLVSEDDPKKSLFVDLGKYSHSVHGKLNCIKCHNDADVDEFPHESPLKPVDCSGCHLEITAMYNTSVHGVLRVKGDADAPSCGSCHGSHEIKSKKEEDSPINRLNSPELCGKCHKSGGKAAARNGDAEQKWEEYRYSVHGKGVEESGLTVSAICVDCHTTHGEKSGDDTSSTVNRSKIVATCSQCHQGIYKGLSQGVHSPLVTKTDKKLPVCSDCHPSHRIMRVEGNTFRRETMIQCGSCHREVAETYFETYHGKGSRLGSGVTAKCSDCHGAHEIHGATDPRSTISKANILTTCRKCHHRATAHFTEYLTHASPNNRHKYPFLFFTFWSMNLLLIGTMTFFGFHTVLWFPRSFRQRLREQKELTKGASGWVRRFPLFYRVLHLFVIISFLGLSLTGMTIKFSFENWAIVISQLFGGLEVMRFIHRICAIITFGYFGIHLIELFVRMSREKVNVWKFLLFRESMIPTWRDIIEFGQTVKWFLRKGPRPNYGRWTYWEKFDYFAVFWGVAIIGSSGLVLWFPVFFTSILPGWLVNIALVIHSDEALLAVGFIFTIHFFNTHMRPEKFPMDTVIFTGRIPLEVFKTERPREYQELIKTDAMQKYIAPQPSKRLMFWARIFGSAALVTGILLILLVAWAMFIRPFIR